MTERVVATAVDLLLAQPTTEAAVVLLRAVEQAPDAARRIAIDRLDEHLRQNPTERSRPIADAVVALRRVGVPS